MGSLPRIAIGLLALIVATAAAPQMPDVAAVAAANGHPARVHRRLTTAFVRDGRTTDVTIDLEGTRRLERACTGPICSGDWFDGRARWTFGPNATPIPDDDADLPFWRTYVALTSLAWAEPGFAAAGGRVRALGSDGTHARYEVRAAGGSTLVAVIDAHTLQPAGVERAPVPDGRLDVPPDAQFSHAEVVAAPLEAPVPLAPHLSGTAAVPLLTAGLPVMPCRVHGIEARCAVDTGTTVTAMTLSFAERLHLEPSGELVIAGFGRNATGVVDSGPVTIGPAEWTALHFAVVSIPHDLGFDILIGNDIIAATPMHLNERARRVSFGAGTGGTPIALRFHDGAAYVQVNLRGRDRNALLDSGDSATVSIGYDDFRRELADLPVLRRTEARGVGGGSDAFVVETTARASDIDFGRTPVVVTRTQHGAHLGWGLVHHCAGGVTIDEPARRAVCASAP